MTTLLSEKVLNDLEEMKSNTLTETASGTSLNITDSDNARIRNLKIYGDIQQEEEPTPDSPTNIEVVGGDITVKLDNGDSTENSIELNLGDMELCGNDDDRDYLFRKAGKWYKHCVFNKIIVTKEDTVVVNSTTDDYTEFKIENVLNPVSASSYSYPITNLFSNTTNNRCVSYNSFILCRVPGQTLINTVEKFNELLEENNLIVYYQLAEETDEEITDETLLTQLEKLYNSKTYKTTTNIYTETDNLSPELEVEYVLDLKTYIDNKISAIST